MIRDGTTLRAAASTFACTRRSILETSGALAALGGAPNLVRLSAALTAALAGATVAGGPTRGGSGARANSLFHSLGRLPARGHPAVTRNHDEDRRNGGVRRRLFGGHFPVFTTENLQHNAAVMFFTTGELPMDAPQKAALTEYVRAGGEFIGVHSATDTFYMWPEYRDLIGGWFNEHPWHQKVRIMVGDPADPLVAFLGPLSRDRGRNLPDQGLRHARLEEYPCGSIRPRST